jgi:hypothetical protein
VKWLPLLALPFVAWTQTPRDSTATSVPAGTAVVTEVGFHSINLELGPELVEHPGDRLRLLGVSGEDEGWVRLTKEAADPRIGGPGKATIISGNPQVGQHLEKIPQWPLALEVYAGSRPAANIFDYGSSSSFHPLAGPSSSERSAEIDPVVALAARAWHPLGSTSNAWLGLGVFVDVNTWKDRVPTRLSTRDSTLSFTDEETGLEFDFRKGFTLYRRLGWFMEFGEALFPGSRYATSRMENTLGLSLEVAPGWSITGSAGLEAWIYGLDKYSIYGGIVSGLSLVWIPSRNR